MLNFVQWPTKDTWFCIGFLKPQSLHKRRSDLRAILTRVKTAIWHSYLVDGLIKWYLINSEFPRSTSINVTSSGIILAANPSFYVRRDTWRASPDQEQPYIWNFRPSFAVHHTTFWGPRTIRDGCMRAFPLYFTSQRQFFQLTHFAKSCPAPLMQAGWRRATNLGVVTHLGEEKVCRVD